MAVEPRVLFEAARVIGQGESEVDLRNATSRANYAAYHQYRPLAQGLPSPPGQGGVHWQLIGRLTQALNRELKSLGYRLDQCRRLRVRADYNIESEFPSASARTALAECEQILNKVESILSTSNAGP